MTPTWAGIPPVEVKSPALFAPVMGMLQRKAAAVIVLALVVFHLGIAWITYRLFHALSPQVREAFLASSDVQTTLMLGGVWVLGLLLLACLFVLRLIDRQVTAPVAELARVSEAVASGELSVPFTPSRVNSEVGRLSRATSGMIVALRKLAGTMRSSARDTTTLSAQITAASESVASAAQQTAATSTALSNESSHMARTIQEIAEDAAKLEAISTSLRGRAQENLRRERRLRTLAQENRARRAHARDSADRQRRDQSRPPVLHAGGTGRDRRGKMERRDRDGGRGVEPSRSGHDASARQSRPWNAGLRERDASGRNRERRAE